MSPGIAVLLALTLPIGIGMAIAGTLLPVAVKSSFAHRPAFASGIGVTGINLGAAISSALAIPIASAWEGWRGALAVFSLATLAICAGVARAEPRRVGGAARPSRPPRLPVRRPVVWGIVLAFALPSVVYYGLVAWISDVYQERGWSDETSGAVLAVMGVASVPAALIVPYLADKMGSRRGWMWFAAGCMGAATFGFAAIPGGGFAWAVLTGIGLGTVFPISLTMCLDVARGPADAGAAAALMFLAGYPIAALGPLGVGAVRDLSGSFDASLWGLFGMTVLMALVLAPADDGAAAAAGGALMDRGVAVALATVIGGTLALQAPLNSLLGRSVGGLTASVVAFAIGLLALLAVSVLAGGLGGVVHVADAPWWAIVGGGLISALYVASIVWTVRALGAGGLTAATIAGQFAVAMVVDHFGWLGVERSPITDGEARGARADRGRDLARRPARLTVRDAPIRQNPAPRIGRRRPGPPTTVRAWRSLMRSRP